MTRQLPERVQQKLVNLPDSPGVYQMLNEAGKVIYVGKARSLKKRLADRAAELALFDPEVEWTVETASFVSRGRNTPLEGRRLRGRVLATFVEGCCRFVSDSLAVRCSGGLLQPFVPASSVSGRTNLDSE